MLLVSPERIYPLLTVSLYSDSTRWVAAGPWLRSFFQIGSYILLEEFASCWISTGPWLRRFFQIGDYLARETPPVPTTQPSMWFHDLARVDGTYGLFERVIDIRYCKFGMTKLAACRLDWYCQKAAALFSPSGTLPTA